MPRQMSEAEIKLTVDNIKLMLQLRREQQEVMEAERSLRVFVKAAWRVIEPGVPYVHGWHIDAISEHLEAVMNGEIRQLIINMPPRHMKPVSVDALVLMHDGGRKRLGDVCVGDWVITHTGEKRPVRAVHEQGEQECLRITTFCGRQTVAALDHPFLTPEGWVDAVDLKIGQSLGCVAVPFTVPERASEDAEYSLAGYFVGDGCVTGTAANITSKDPDYIADVLKCCQRLGFTAKLSQYVKVGQYETDVTRINVSGGVREWLSSIGLAGKNSYTKTVPEFIFCGTNQQIALFLAAYFHCDGTLNKKTEERKNFLVSFSSVSKELLRGVQHLLLRIGINSRLRSRSIKNNTFAKSLGQPYPYFCLDITREHDAALFLEKIPLHGRKRDKLIGHHPLKQRFAERLLADPIVAIERIGVHPCRCLTVEEHGTFTADDLVVHNSSLVSVMWPAWVWITDPTRQFLYASYAENLSIRDSRKCRNLIRSPWYQKAWGERYKIVSDQNEKRRFDNDKTGYRLATSVGGTNTGEGGHIIVYDDPNNVNEVTSDTIREGVNDWHDQVMSTRLNDPKTGARVLIQQRSHERDLSGYLLEKGGWDQLILPAEYEGPQKVTSIGWKDPRKEFGQLLWPERFGKKEIEELKRDLGPTGAAGQLQQRPSPGEGAKFKREWWKFYNDPGVTTGPVRIMVPGGQIIEKQPEPLPEAFEHVVHGWDMAFKEESDSDLVSGQVWGRVGANVYLLARESERMDFPRTVAAVRRMSAEFPCPEKMVEDKANGPAVIQTLRNEIPGLIPSPIDGGLLALATSITGYVEAGNCYLPNPDLHPWVLDYIEQFAVFPRGKHDDDVSAGAHALRRLFDSVANAAAPEFRVVPRKGEPTTACHVKQDREIAAECQPHWRRWIAVSPGQTSAALWICETPKGSLRVYRELDLDGADAHESGRLIAAATLPDVRAYMRMVHLSAKWHISVLLEKEAFVPIEPIGSYAEMLEAGMLSFDPTGGDWDQRESVKAELRMAKFSAERADTEEASWDRLRDLLRFKPADYEELAYDRAKAIALSRSDIGAYQRYMASVEGRVEGEYPKIKFADGCKRTISALGASRRAEDITNPFLRALLLGISAPPGIMAQKPVKEVPWRGPQRGGVQRFMRRAM